MKIEKMANIILTEDEMKEAIRTWLFYGGKNERSDDILKHLHNNHWTIESQEDGFVICVDGILEIEEM